jgi:hypothetical protein
VVNPTIMFDVDQCNILVYEIPVTFPSTMFLKRRGPVTRRHETAHHTTFDDGSAFSYQFSSFHALLF